MCFYLDREETRYILPYGEGLGGGMVRGPLRQGRTTYTNSTLEMVVLRGLKRTYRERRRALGKSAEGLLVRA